MLGKLHPGHAPAAVPDLQNTSWRAAQPGLKVEDPYADSNTWFSLSVANEASSLSEAGSELCEFQRNVRASKAMRCHTNHWVLGQQDEEFADNTGVRGWLESLESSRELTVGVFPLARYPAWINSVWKIEVELHLKADAGGGPPASVPDIASGSARIVPLEEVMDIVQSAIPPSSQHPRKKAAALGEILERQREQYRRTGSRSDLDEAILVARMAVDLLPADAPSRPRFLTELESLIADRDARTGVAQEAG
ncbi:TPR domain-containing protein [Colletotrichum plurivorum]|uniref:TPR domain-containing protein n=1 Tax=Colletotrichum plurivorum TaxID=2175906 RepID=A0A8H6J4X9_9PEZI|nr:TPR domain-containing protein [Colletotrichum plurivorum]